MNKKVNSHPLRALVSWAFFDWANSAFSSVIQTFVFAAYFTRQVASNETTGTAEWGAAISIAGFLVAIGSPILGAIADEAGHRKRWLAVFVIVCFLATASLWFIKPSPIYVLPAVILVAIGTIASEFTFVFYSSMLPSLAPRSQLGRWSGWGWGMGYAGGTLALTLSLVLFIYNGGLFFPDADPSVHIRACFVLVAIWLLVFSLPFFLFTPEAPIAYKSIGNAIRDGLKQLSTTLTHIRQYAQIARFLIAYIFYIEGLTTLFAFGGVYAANMFDMSNQDVMIFGIALNLIGGIGAAIFAFVDDKIGAKRTILISLAGLIITASLALTAHSTTLFWIFGLTMGLWVGPIQASTRSFMARIAPAGMRTQMFGFLALSGKATAFMGPALVSWATYASGDQRLGMSPIIVLLVIGGIAMLTVPRDD
ncbi:MAG: MFS transporter [Nitrosomonas sp.]|nr:MAG: MFS transporter [Nitrosomonas sp.]